jgi:methionyl-tRNA formyltransferase
MLGGCSRFGVRALSVSSFRNPWRCNRSFSVERGAPEPLRILFCGSDDFSISSLKALDSIRLHDRGLVSSVDVVCRPGKRVGRGLKEIRDGESI